MTKWYIRLVLVLSFFVFTVCLVMGILLATHTYADYTRTLCKVENCSVTVNDECITCHDAYCEHYTVSPCTTLRYTYFLYSGGETVTRNVTLLDGTVCPELVDCYYRQGEVEQSLTDSSNGWPFSTREKVGMVFSFTIVFVIFATWVYIIAWGFMYVWGPQTQPLIARQSR